MTTFDPEPPPSWALPISIGAAVSFLGTVLVMLVGMIGQLGQLVACCCFAPIAFVPFGVVPAMVAVRRDPELTESQGFTVTFIGVGFGMICWAAIAASAIDRDEVEQVARESAQQMREAGQQLSPEELEQAVEMAGKLAPFVPAIGAVIVTTLAALVAMGTVSLIQRRANRSPS